MICNENNLVSKHSHYDILLPIVCQLSAKLGEQRLKLKRGFRPDFFLYSRKQFLVDSNDSIYTDLQHFKIKQINVGGQIVNYSQCQDFLHIHPLRQLQIMCIFACVFFIVLDLRLTMIGEYSGTPFFYFSPMILLVMCRI